MNEIKEAYMEGLREGWSMFWRVAFSPIAGLRNAVQPLLSGRDSEKHREHGEKHNLRLS